MRPGEVCEAFIVSTLFQVPHYSQKVEGAAVLTYTDAILRPPPTAVRSLAWVGRKHIQQVLTYFGGSVSQAAKLLSLQCRSLQRELSKRSPRC